MIVTPELLSAALSLIGTFTALLASLAVVHAVTQQYTGGRQIDISVCFSRASNRFIIALAAFILFALALIASAILIIILVGIPLLFYVLVIWFFHQQAIMVERRGPIEALGRSRELVKGTWWRVFGIGVVFVLLIMALSLSSVIAGLVFGLFNDILGSLVITLTNVLVFPILPIGATLVYIDLRVRKEGYDLEAMAAEVSPVPSGFSI